MIVRSRKLIPVALCGVVLFFVVIAEVITRRVEEFRLINRLEWMTYDWRVRIAAKREAPVASNLGFISINDSSIWFLRSGRLGYTNTDPVQVSLHWPRYVYAQLVQELDKQGVDVVGFDVLLTGLRPRHEVVELPDDSKMISDEYFAEQIGQSGRVVLAASSKTESDPVLPPLSFWTNAWAIGDISSHVDADGVARRTKAFEDYIVWDSAIREARERVDLKVNTNRVVVVQSEGQESVVLPIGTDGQYEKARLIELGNDIELPRGGNRFAPAFRRVRVWDLGITMAAHYLGIDLAAAVVVPGSHISLKGTNSVRREIPIDDQNRFNIDWSLGPKEPRVLHESFHGMLHRHFQRAAGKPMTGDYPWRGRVVLVGSTATGNDLTDIGSTPLGSHAPLTTRYLNIVNSMLVNRFVRQPSYLLEFALILGLGLFSGIFTWNFRALFAALCVLLLASAYTALALYLYIESRYALPLVLPVGGLVAVHMTLVTYRVLVEQKERRRIRGIFSKIVSPNVVNELLQAERLEFGGARREITVFFSDVRGFTEMTDESHARAEDYVRAHRLSQSVADAYFDQQAQEILKTVNLYLGTIADVIKKSEGTLDKYIGDCVMAFWGAPTPNEKHAVSCVRAAIEAQRAIDALNRQRSAENLRRERENAARADQGVPPLPLLKILSMGAGINTGVVTLGLMGSEQHVYNYTVFGRDVNLAARLEGLSVSGRVLIGEATYRAVLRDDPALAAQCRELSPATVKGFRTPVKVFEVTWTDGAGSIELPTRENRPVDQPSSQAP